LQCKYKTNNKVESNEIRGFLGMINENDVIGLFVTNSGYTFKTRKQTETSKKNIYLTTTNKDENNYIHKILDYQKEIKHEEKFNIGLDLLIETTDNSKININLKSIVINGTCIIKIENFKF
jgi:hypothetical protein